MAELAHGFGVPLLEGVAAALAHYLLNKSKAYVRGSELFGLFDEVCTVELHNCALLFGLNA